jgi:hypothetical protein
MLLRRIEDCRQCFPVKRCVMVIRLSKPGRRVVLLQLGRLRNHGGAGPEVQVIPVMAQGLASGLMHVGIVSGLERVRLDPLGDSHQRNFSLNIR